MSDSVMQNLGLIGAIIFVSAYLPQIIHLLKVKDSTGISIFSWAVWLIGALLLIVYAVSQRDIVFMALTILESSALLAVIILSIYYRRNK